MRLTASRVSCREFQRGHRPVTHAVVVIVIVVVDSEMRQRRLRGRTARIEIITRAMIRFRIPAGISHAPPFPPFPELVGSQVVFQQACRRVGCRVGGRKGTANAPTRHPRADPMRMLRRDARPASPIMMRKQRRTDSRCVRCNRVAYASRCSLINVPSAASDKSQ